MTARMIVKPAEIEPQLLKIWEDLAKHGKTKACLFNLIVYTKLNQRHDYIRMRVQKIIDKFPCRILFITSDPDPSKDYLKTAVSVAMQGEESPIACDNIDIGVGEKSERIVPFVILPHILPDLPVYLLWAEDICHTPPLFHQLSHLATRIIFDSETSEHLFEFAKSILQVHKHKEVGDLNWARTEPWRDLIASQFYRKERVDLLKDILTVKISYNATETESFCHLKIQALYIVAWLTSFLHWKIKKIKEKTITCENGILFQLIPSSMAQVAPGGILSIQMETKKEQFHFARDSEHPHVASIITSTEETCELPFHFMLGKDISGLSLTKEVTTHGTSHHFIAVLKVLEKTKLC